MLSHKEKLLVDAPTANQTSLKKLESSKDDLVDIQNQLERARFEREDAEQVKTKDQAAKLTALLADMMKKPLARVELQNQLAQACSIAETVKAAM